MTALNVLSQEMMGFFILLLGVLAKLIFSEIEEFWLALATAFTLLLIMHIRSHLSLPSTSKETPSP